MQHIDTEQITLLIYLSDGTRCKNIPNGYQTNKQIVTVNRNMNETRTLKDKLCRIAY